MSGEKINEIRKTLIEILDTVKIALQEEPVSYLILEGDFIVLRDICNSLHLANAGDTHDLLTMINTYQSSRMHGDSQAESMKVLDEVIEQDR